MSIENITKKIETPRLILRKYIESDAEDMFKNWAAEEETTKFMPWGPHKSLEESKESVQMFLDKYKKPNEGEWAIELRETGEVIGSIGCSEVSDKHKYCAIGYCIGQKYWSKGITTEALTAIISYLFENTDMNRIEALHDVENPASGKVMEKAGMTYEGTLRNGFKRKDGVFGDMKIWSILRREYESTI